MFLCPVIALVYIGFQGPMIASLKADIFVSAATAMIACLLSELFSRREDPAQKGPAELPLILAALDADCRLRNCGETLRSRIQCLGDIDLYGHSGPQAARSDREIPHRHSIRNHLRWCNRFAGEERDSKRISALSSHVCRLV